MWTKKAHFIVIYIKINRFALPIVIPAFAINSLVTELCDLVNFFTFFSRKVTNGINLVETAVHSMCEFEKYDFVDINVDSKEDNDNVRIKIYTR